MRFIDYSASGPTFWRPPCSTCTPISFAAAACRCEAEHRLLILLWQQWRHWDVTRRLTISTCNMTDGRAADVSSITACITMLTYWDARGATRERWSIATRVRRRFRGDSRFIIYRPPKRFPLRNFFPRLSFSAEEVRQRRRRRREWL